MNVFMMCKLMRMHFSVCIRTCTLRVHIYASVYGYVWV